MKILVKVMMLSSLEATGSGFCASQLVKIPSESGQPTCNTLMRPLIHGSASLKLSHPPTSMMALIRQMAANRPEGFLPVNRVVMWIRSL